MPASKHAGVAGSDPLVLLRRLEYGLGLGLEHFFELVLGLGFGFGLVLR